MLRGEIASGSPLGRELESYTSRGDLVPDDLMFDVLVPAVVAAHHDTGGYLLDGFPRTMPQALRAAELDVHLGLSGDAAVYLTAPSDVLVERLLARARTRDAVMTTRMSSTIVWQSSAPRLGLWSSTTAAAES